MTYTEAVPSTEKPGTVALLTDDDHEGTSYLTPAEARALAVELEEAAFQVEQNMSKETT